VKFLVDAQLPKSLSVLLNQNGFDAIHTLDLPEQNKTKDCDILKIADSENRVIISKDSDFLESFVLKSKPKKLIIIKTGNIPNKNLIKLFEEHLETIIKMISRSNLIEISTTEIAERE